MQVAYLKYLTDCTQLVCFEYFDGVDACFQVQVPSEPLKPARKMNSFAVRVFVLFFLVRVRVCVHVEHFFFHSRNVESVLLLGPFFLSCPAHVCTYVVHACMHVCVHALIISNESHYLIIVSYACLFRFFFITPVRSLQKQRSKNENHKNFYHKRE